MLEAKSLRTHPFSEHFPLMSREEIQVLANDILENGLKESIILTSDGNTIVDGRNRFRACGVVGVEPRFRLLPKNMNEAEILRLIASANVQTRNFTPGQLAMIGHYLTQALERFPISDLENFPRIREYDNKNHRAYAAVVIGVSSKTIWQAMMIVKHYPTLEAQVRSGELRLNTAYERVMADRGLRGGGGVKIPNQLSERPPKGRDNTRRGIEARRAWLKHYAEQKLSSQEIASRLDISDETVRRLARRFNIELPGDVWSYKRRKRSFDVNRVAQVVADDLVAMADSLPTIREHLGEINPDKAAEWARIYWRTARHLSNLARLMHFDVKSTNRTNGDNDGSA